jgi:methylphosphotriester-DNA--protein-cysteine methyltransferase
MGTIDECPTVTRSSANCPSSDRVGESGKRRLEVEIFPDTTGIEERVESTSALCVRCVWRRLADRREQRGELARLTRFHRALHAARDNDRPNWASIAAASGYYDQAHLITEFRAIAGVTPRALLHELSLAASVG